MMIKKRLPFIQYHPSQTEVEVLKVVSDCPSGDYVDIAGLPGLSQNDEESPRQKTRLIIKKKLVRNEQMIENDRISNKLDRVKPATQSRVLPFRYQQMAEKQIRDSMEKTFATSRSKTKGEWAVDSMRTTKQSFNLNHSPEVTVKSKHEQEQILRENKRLYTSILKMSEKPQFAYIGLDKPHKSSKTRLVEAGFQVRVPVAGKVSYIEAKGVRDKGYQNESLFLSTLQRDRFINSKNQGGHSRKCQKQKNYLIDQQNERILRALKTIKGSLDFTKMAVDSVHNRKVSQNMSVFSSSALKSTYALADKKNENIQSASQRITINDTQRMLQATTLNDSSVRTIDRADNSRLKLNQSVNVTSNYWNNHEGLIRKSSKNLSPTLKSLQKHSLKAQKQIYGDGVSGRNERTRVNDTVSPRMSLNQLQSLSRIVNPAVRHQLQTAKSIEKKKNQKRLRPSLLLQSSDGLFTESFYLPDLQGKERGSKPKASNHMFLQSLSSLNADGSHQSIDVGSKKKLHQSIDAAIKDLSLVRDHNVINKRKTRLASILNTKGDNAPEEIEIHSVNNWFNADDQTYNRVFIGYHPHIQKISISVFKNDEPEDAKDQEQEFEFENEGNSEEQRKSLDNDEVLVGDDILENKLNTAGQSSKFEFSKIGFDINRHFSIVSNRFISKELAKEIFSKFNWNVESLVDHLYIAKIDSKKKQAKLEIRLADPTGVKRFMGQQAKHVFGRNLLHQSTESFLEASPGQVSEAVIEFDFLKDTQMNKTVAHNFKQSPQASKTLGSGGGGFAQYAQNAAATRQSFDDALNTPLSGGWNNDSQHHESTMTQQNGPIVSPTDRSTHDPLDIGRNIKASKLAGIIDPNDINYRTVDTIRHAQNNRNHQSRKKFRLKKAKPSDIFFGQEIQAESQRMLNIESILQMRNRQQAMNETSQSRVGAQTGSNSPIAKRQWKHNQSPAVDQTQAATAYNSIEISQANQRNTVYLPKTVPQASEKAGKNRYSPKRLHKKVTVSGHKFLAQHSLAVKSSTAFKVGSTSQQSLSTIQSGEQSKVYSESMKFEKPTTLHTLTEEELSATKKGLPDSQSSKQREDFMQIQEEHENASEQKITHGSQANVSKRNDLVSVEDQKSLGKSGGLKSAVTSRDRPSVSVTSVTVRDENAASTLGNDASVGKVQLSQQSGQAGAGQEVHSQTFDLNTQENRYYQIPCNPKIVFHSQTLIPQEEQEEKPVGKVLRVTDQAAAQQMNEVIENNFEDEDYGNEA